MSDSVFWRGRILANSSSYERYLDIPTLASNEHRKLLVLYEEITLEFNRGLVSKAFRHGTLIGESYKLCASSSRSYD